MSIKTKLTEIANAIRYALGTETKYSLAQMPPLIRSLNFKYKTDDIYYNFFKFDCSKYGDALIFNSYMYFYSGNTNTENRTILFIILIMIIVLNLKILYIQFSL